MEKLTAKSLKDVLWTTLNDVKEGNMEAGKADAIASQAREIIRLTKVQLQISTVSKRDVPAEVIAFNDGVS